MSEDIKDITKNLQYKELVDSLSLMYETESELSKGFWTDSDCVFCLVSHDNENVKFLLYSILETWEKPSERVSPFWYLNEIVRRAPAHINWLKVNSYIEKIRYRYGWFSSQDKRSFNKAYPYLKNEIAKIITGEEEKELTPKEFDIKYFTNKTERKFWIQNRKDELLKSNPQRKFNDIANQILQELTTIFNDLDLTLDLTKDRILRIFNEK